MSAPGLSFPGASLNNGMRQARGGNQGYPPPQPKQPALNQQQSSPYSHYTPHHQQSNYPQLYATPNPSPVQHNVQNGSRSQQAQLPPVPSSRPRSTNHRQIPSQTNNPPLSYTPLTMPQHIPPNISQQPMNPQSMSQQPLSSQSIGQQSMGQQTLPQQTLGQNSLSQQQMSQQAISQQAINHQQSMAQDTSMLSQATPPHNHSVLTSQAPAQSQAQQPPQPATQQINADEPVVNHEAQHDDTMEVDSMGESGEDGGENTKGEKFMPRNPMGAMMSAPPQGGSYPTLDAVHKAVLEYCTSVGYAIVIGRSKKTVPGLKKVLFVCDRAGKPPKRVNPEMRKRKTSSRKCDCQFGFFAIEQRTQWTVRYRPDANHLTHNHGPSESPMLHPAARKLDSKMVATVKELKDQGIGVPETLTILQNENPNVPLMPRDIYNARAAITRNPNKVTAALAEDQPAIYSKPKPSAEQRLIAELRKELAKVKEEWANEKAENQKKVTELEETLREKDTKIQKFEMFVDICNERVMFQREKLTQLDDINPAGNNS